jgi:long-chain acyl-CoA synthetase
MHGYYKDPDSTAAVLTGGWLRTGDTGAIDGEGRVQVKGRKADVIVLSTGKKVSAAGIEAKLESCELIRNAFVVGTGRKFLSAVIVPDLAKIAALMPEMSGETSLCESQVVALYAEAVDRCCADLAGFEQVKRFCFLPERTLGDSDLVTPTLKLRRSLLEEKFACHIERLYREDVPFLIGNDDRRSGKAQAAIT